MRSGMKAEIGMYRSGETTGSKNRFTGSNAPIRTPSGRATAEARKNARRMRRVETRTAWPRSYCRKSCSVPRTTSDGDGRKSGGARPPYVATHHAPRTSAGATSPRTSAVARGSGARSWNSPLLRPFFSLTREHDLDLRPPVELPARLRRVRGHRLRRAAPDRLEALRRDVREVLQDVVL